MKKNNFVILALVGIVSCSIACKSEENKTEEIVVINTDSIKMLQDSIQKVKETADSLYADSVSNATNSSTTTIETTVKTTRKKYQPKIIFVPYEFDQTMKIEADRYGVYNRAEIMPSYPGGEKALEKFIQKNVIYPPVALENGVSGTVLLTFLVDEAGKIYSPATVSKNIGSGLEQESVRLVRLMPTWNPGQIKGRNVKTRFTLPIKFELY